MTPMTVTNSYINTATAPRTATRSRLDFHTMTLDDISRVAPLLEASPYRTCDFSIGGIFMWIDYFRYSSCIVDDTLFIMGVTENDVTNTAFSLPVGRMPLNESIPMLREYCRRHSIPLILSAVPADAIDELKALGATGFEELTDWADYIYDAQAMATFSGKKLSKKRNHVNRFIADHPNYIFEPLTAENMQAVTEFFKAQHLKAGKSITADFERLQVLDVLRHADKFGFEGAVITLPESGVVAFTLGEVIGDTLYVHIEKMDHEIAGAGETICRDFAAMMLERHPEVKYINREEDTGDEGLRKAKQSYHPLPLLTKYNVTFPD